MIELALALAGGLAIGASLGLLGGGGTMLTLPLLLSLGVEPKPAIALSLAVVAVTAALATARHARSGRVDWRAAAVFGPPAAAGGFAGGRAAAFVPGEVLVLLFTALMLAAGVAMLRPRSVAAARPASPRGAALALQGAAIGALTGLVGAGGGFLFVPTLAILGGLPMRRAVGTSLVLIAANSSAALLGHLGHARPALSLGAAITCGAAAGAWLGSALAGRVEESALRRGFGWLVLGVAVWMLLRSPLVRGWIAA
jgi:hypothetical protein